MSSRFVIASVLVSLLGACELQPPPPQPAAAPQVPVPANPTPPTPTPPTPTPGTPTPAPTPAAPPAIIITPECIDVGKHVADILIAGAEPAQRAVFETEKDRIVRATGEVCVTQAWAEPARSCYLKATNQAGLKACEAKFPPPAQPQTRQPPAGVEVIPTPGPAGAGSAAPTRPGRPRGAGIENPRAGSAAPVRPGAAAASSPTRAAGSGSATPARPAAGSGSAAPRAGGGMMPPRAGSGAGR